LASTTAATSRNVIRSGLSSSSTASAATADDKDVDVVHTVGASPRPIGGEDLRFHLTAGSGSRSGNE
jgi:hypothetical protein